MHSKQHGLLKRNYTSSNNASCFDDGKPAQKKQKLSTCRVDIDSIRKTIEHTNIAKSDKIKDELGKIDTIQGYSIKYNKTTGNKILSDSKTADLLICGYIRSNSIKNFDLYKIILNYYNYNKQI